MYICNMLAYLQHSCIPATYLLQHAYIHIISTKHMHAYKQHAIVPKKNFLIYLILKKINLFIIVSRNNSVDK